MKRTIWLLLASLLVTCTIIGSQKKVLRPVTTANHLKERSKVTLDVYSGRPNPTWSLTEEQTESLLGIIRDLPPASPARTFDGLGYRGFMVSIENSASVKPSQITVYKGKVRQSDGCNVRFLNDKDRRVEHLLLESGGSHLTPALYKRIEQEIELPGR